MTSHARTALAIAIAGLLLAGGCASSVGIPIGPPDGGADADVDADVVVDVDADSDAEPPGDAEADRDRDITHPIDVLRCGDGVLDPEEECDDENRLDGDGCDWLCRRGDGDPPREADPGLPEYVPSEEVVDLDTVLSTNPFTSRWLPLSWTGSELATALDLVLETHFGAIPDMTALAVRRLDPGGAALVPEWTDEPASSEGATKTDLVWTGSGFGLFYVVPEVGISFVPLDPRGQPTAPSRLVVELETIGWCAADRSDEGFVLLWADEASSWIRLVGSDGSTTGFGDQVQLGHGAAGMPNAVTGSGPDVATGTNGFGVLIFEAPIEDESDRRGHFYLLDHELDLVATTNSLSMSRAGEIARAGDGFIAVFSAREAIASDTCLASLDSAGLLVGPPSCDPHRCFAPRLVVGDEEYLVLCDSPEGLEGLQADREGILSRTVNLDAEASAFAAAWAGDAFGLVWLETLSDDAHVGNLMYRRIPPLE